MNLSQAACDVLTQPDPAEKVRLTFEMGERWKNGDIEDVGHTLPPDVPARPSKPHLRSPSDMPKRSPGTGKRRTALVHAIAHIELNAIDLAWDAVARFVCEDMPKAYFDDWVQVAVDEARHFEMLNHRLHQLDATYGDFPAHNGLWEAAQTTKDDILDRMALVPMILEARGLDTTPATVARLKQNGDPDTANIMALIAKEEI
ncbi:MAG: ferritin-like domain-containing protein, partial [Magnetovibrio sp.]|nr:ferritin-like domain-containing protein [Magnetovibrio sp.]